MDELLDDADGEAKEAGGDDAGWDDVDDDDDEKW